MQFRPDMLDDAPNGIRVLNPVPGPLDVVPVFSEKRQPTDLEIEGGLVHLLRSLDFFCRRYRITGTTKREDAATWLKIMGQEWKLAKVLVRAVAAKGWDQLGVAIYEELELVQNVKFAFDEFPSENWRPWWEKLLKGLNRHVTRFQRLSARLSAHYRYFVEDRGGKPLHSLTTIPADKRTQPLTKTAAAALMFAPKAKSQRDAARNKLKRLIDAGDILCEPVPRESVVRDSKGKRHRPRYYFHIDQLKRGES